MRYEQKILWLNTQKKVTLIEKERKAKSENTATMKKKDWMLKITYRTVIQWSPTHSNGRESRWLWARCLHISYAIGSTRTVHINCWSWWIGCWKSASCCSCVWWRWWPKTLCGSSSCLIIVHNWCKKWNRVHENEKEKRETENWETSIHVSRHFVYIWISFYIVVWIDSVTRRTHETEETRSQFYVIFIEFELHKSITKIMWLIFYSSVQLFILTSECLICIWRKKTDPRISSTYEMQWDWASNKFGFSRIGFIDFNAIK